MKTEIKPSLTDYKAHSVRVFIKFICLCLVFVIMTGCFAGCKDTPDDVDPPVVTDDEPKIADTAHDLILGGATDYKIVIPEDATYYEQYAGTELASFFEEASGLRPELISDTGLAFSEAGRYLSVGDTVLRIGAGVDVSSGVSNQGFKIVTKGKSVIIAGGGDLGTLYGTYEFLHHTFGFESYASTEIALDTGVTSRKLPDFNITDNPDIEWRMPNYLAVDNAVTSPRMRYSGNVFMTERGNFVHNTFDEFIPKWQYESKYPDFYAYPQKRQLCYNGYGTNTGEGNKKAELQAAAFERIKYLINKHFSAGQFLESISFTHEDNANWCTCDKCKAQKEHYGTDAASLILFVNPLAVQLKEWLSEAYPGREVNIVIFAYISTEKAPVKVAAGGGYEPIDESMVLEDNVSIFYAPFYADYNYDFDADINISYKETLEKWTVLSDKLYLWTYSLNPHNYFAWYDSFNSMQPIYQMAKKYNAYFLFDQGKYNTTAGTGFDYLKMYLNAKLAWNTDANVVKLTDNFFKHFFKEGAGAMREYFESFRLWMQYVREYMQINGFMQNTEPYKEEHLPKKVLTDWQASIEKAYADILPVKDKNPDLYQTLYDRICSESLAVRFYLIDLHSSTYSVDESLAMKKSFRADADRLGFVHLSEYGAITEIYESWKI